MQNLDNDIWVQFKLRLKERWVSLQDKEIEPCRDDFSKLSEKIHKMSREPKAVVQDYIDNLWFELFVRGAKKTYQGSALQQRLDV